MICKFCKAEIEDGSKLCPLCGEELTEKETAEELTEMVEEEIFAEEVEEASDAARYDEDDDDDDEDDDDDDEWEAWDDRPKKKIWPTILKVTGIVLILGVLTVILLAAFGVKIKIPKNDIHRKSDYTVSDEKHVKKGDVVVATVGDAEMTNAQLQLYYRLEVLNFVNYFGSYAGSIGLDISQPLSGQTCYYDDSLSWEQYFLDSAIQTWQTYQSMAQEAKSNGFVLSEEIAAEIDRIPEVLEEDAAEEYGSADAMIKALLGPACTVEDYRDYFYLNTYVNEYYASRYEDMVPTDEEVEAYFTENEAAFEEKGITRDGGLVSSVRHILVSPKSDESTDSTEPTTDSTEPTEAVDANGYTESDWDACYQLAEEILQEWKDGDATEDSFAALVPVYTEDLGSAETGGLYEGINPTSSYVENFLAWAVDPSRQPGDTGIVQSEYGYHIMYFVSGTPYWMEAAREELTQNEASNFLKEVKGKYPVKVRYGQIALSLLDLTQ